MGGLYVGSLEDGPLTRFLAGDTVARRAAPPPVGAALR